MMVRNESIEVALRPLTDAPDLIADLRDVWVVLDGQQRLTALYQALAETGPERYFVDFTALAGGLDLLQDDVIISIPARRSQEQISSAIDEGTVLVPFPALRDSSAFFAWLHSTESSRLAIDINLGAIFGRLIHPVRDYSMPATVLGGDLSVATVATVFERLNRLGQPLNVFDLLVARLQSANFNLRSAWDGALTEYASMSRILGDNGLTIMSAISLLVTSNARRSALLDLPPREVAASWDKATAAAEATAQLLIQEGFRKRELVPSDTLIAVMIAASMAGADRRLLKGYLWHAVVSGRYDSFASNAAAQDLRFLKDGLLPPDYGDLVIDMDALERNTRRSSRTLWSSITGLLLVQRPLDLATGLPVTSEDDRVEEDWHLTSFAKGGQDFETEYEVPLRSRTVTQIVSTPRGLKELHKLGLTRLVERRLTDQPLAGASIDDCLKSQLLPTANALLSGMPIAEVVKFRVAKIRNLLERKLRFDN
jgi:hypothetical protein